ncbi:M20/M25/M40 family metallo-hydrolase [Pelolinea submarina]|uniref:Carboxypeptidase PM20D1 n=1 Tax=Pelolinea submarina TaxID=913107 RepID=A0A347ZPV2_9CHLR|nr:M20/M25/M40 family metallo-hydrolase [Pelolinea submarina]REG04652.1 carboxypeptidase PM20D1 [Pelolinea submarina]BBB47333.1 carboxypeptidase PM20D1 [Pelolinea submarina]
MAIVYIVVGVLLVLIAFMLIRTAQLGQASEPVAKIEMPLVDTKEISQHLSEMIQIKSISKEGIGNADPKPFQDIHAWMEKAYPLLTSRLEKTTINTCSLLFRLPGSDTSLAPVLFNAHMDVVPVDESTLPEWKVEPFSGTIREGYVWGRGAIDMKGQAVGLLESMEALLRDGYAPKRTIYLAFGHDEEVMGFEGSKKIVEHLKAQGVQLSAMLDEGGFIATDVLPGVSEPFAMVGISEKGYLTLKLQAFATPGHSSQPPRQTAIGVIARAIALLDDHPMPAHLEYFLPTLLNLAHLLPFGQRFVIANAWLFKGALINSLSRSQQLNASLRTTHAATIINGGIKDNVLPASVTAKVNLRTLPGESIESVIAYVTKVIDDPRVKVSIDEENGGWESSAISPVDTPAYRSLDLVTRQVFDNVPVAPFVFLAATDSRHYQSICGNIFKFSPVMLSSGELQGMHGINERILQKSFTKMVVFYMRIMRVWGDAEF